MERSRAMARLYPLGYRVSWMGDDYIKNLPWEIHFFAGLLLLFAMNLIVGFFIAFMFSPRFC